MVGQLGHRLHADQGQPQPLFGRRVNHKQTWCHQWSQSTSSLGRPSHRPHANCHRPPKCKLYPPSNCPPCLMEIVPPAPSSIRQLSGIQIPSGSVSAGGKVDMCWSCGQPTLFFRFFLSSTGRRTSSSLGQFFFHVELPCYKQRWAVFADRLTF